MDDLLFRGDITSQYYSIVDHPEDEVEVDAFLVVRHFRVMISELGT